MIDFKSAYSREDLLNFLRDSFIKDFQKDIREIDLPVQKYIQKASYLGDSRELELSVFEFLHEGNTEKRVSLTKEAFNILRDSGSFKAIGIFHSKDTDDWRFSLMTATPVVNEKGKVKAILSNPKRYSFLLGPNAKVNTPTKFLVTKGEIKSFEDLKERFSIEVVNKEFYKEISKLFVQLVGGTLGKGKNKQVYKSILMLPGVKDSSQTAQEFAVRLIGRLIFCWFLREKKDGSKNSLMPHSLLSLEASIKYENYYHDVLEPIFFKVLNVPLSSRKEEKYASDPYDKIPYLNGGLFSSHDDDFYSPNESKQEMNNQEVVVPDKWIQQLFEILETYNFTIDENSAFDEELSIDPEMLGRIFENLLAEINPETGESARKSTGSYYTPRVIVDYMVDESLYRYLKNKTDLTVDKLRTLISYDLDDDSVNPLTDVEKEIVVKALDELKILDPACGSGAFPIGILQKIVFMLQQLDPNGQAWFKTQLKTLSPELKRNLEKENEENNFDYIRKQGIIRNNIFGIDIQPIATEIARLRCFLTLIVDQRVDDNKENRGIEPLPNLDFKFVTANSLVSLPKKEEYGQKNFLQDESGISELKNLRDQYFNATAFEKDSLVTDFMRLQKSMALRNSKDSVGEYTHLLTEWDPFSHSSTKWFEPEWMFGISNGFDIIIGNPPYINISNIDKESRNLYKKTFSITKNKVDIYAYFIEKASSLIAKNGIITFIIPHTWKATSSFYKLRKLIFDNFRVYKVVELNNGIFEANVKPLIISMGNEGLKSISIPIFNSDFIRINDIPLEEITSSDDYAINSHLAQYERELIKKVSKLGKPLGEICKFTRGIKTSNDKKFIKKQCIDHTYKKVIRGRDIKAYHYLWNGEYIWYQPNIMKEKVGSLPHSKELFETKEKIVLQRISKGLVASLDVDSVYALDTCLVSDCSTLDKTFNLKYLLAILNSSIINYWYSRKFLLPTVSGYELHQVPIIKPSKTIEMEIIALVDMIGASIQYKNTELKTFEYINMLDQIIYQLYGISDKEITFIKEALSRSRA